MKWFYVFLELIFISGCQINNVNINPIPIPNRFEQPEFPKDNTPTIDKIALGKKLFFDPQLSKNNNISCASCHLSEFAFSDTVAQSIGTNGELGFRNSPSIVNMAYKILFHKDGGVRSLELQALSPIIDTNEMSGDFRLILDYLSSNQEYVRMFELAFDTLPSIYGLTRAIASYERSLLYGNSPYDLFMEGDMEALTSIQIAGMKLFNSKKLNCVACHSGHLFTDYSYQNIGLEPQFEDSGRARITFNHSDAGKFEVPSLRNVGVTQPYMHNGSITTLEEVIQYFEKGGGNHPNKSELITPFSITLTERNQLISFLESLTDKRFRKN